MKAEGGSKLLLPPAPLDFRERRGVTPPLANVERGTGHAVLGVLLRGCSASLYLHITNQPSQMLIKQTDNIDERTRNRMGPRNCFCDPVRWFYDTFPGKGAAAWPT